MGAKSRLQLGLVIARSEATKQSILSLRGEMDCFTSLAMTVLESPALSTRLLRQMFMRPAEIGRGRILADLDDAASDGAGAGKMLEQRFAVIAADRTGEFRQILVEGAEHLQHSVL